MSKRITISLTDSLYKNFENEAAKAGLKPIDLINRSIKETVEIQKINSMLEVQISKSELDKNELKIELKSLKDNIQNLRRIVIESMRMNAEYLSYSKVSTRSLLMNLMKGKTQEESQKIMEEILKESIVDAKKTFDKALGVF